MCGGRGAVCGGPFAGCRSAGRWALGAGDWAGCCLLLDWGGCGHFWGGGRLQAFRNPRYNRDKVFHKGVPGIHPPILPRNPHYTLPDAFSAVVLGTPICLRFPNRNPEANPRKGIPRKKPKRNSTEGNPPKKKPKKQIHGRKSPKTNLTSTKKGQPSRIVLYIPALSATSPTITPTITITITTTTTITNQPSSATSSHYTQITSIPCSASICRPRSLSLNFWILPLPVRGKPSTNNTYFGIL